MSDLKICQRVLPLRNFDNGAAVLVRTKPTEAWSSTIHTIDDERRKRQHLVGVVLDVNRWWDEEQECWQHNDHYIGEICLLQPMAGFELEVFEDGGTLRWVEEPLILAFVDDYPDQVSLRNLDSDPLPGEPWD